jgi:hypothetical protein
MYALLVGLRDYLERFAEVDGRQRVLPHLQVGHAQVVEVILRVRRLALRDQRVLLNLLVPFK